MDPRDKPEKRCYVVLLFIEVDHDYYSLESEKRAELTTPHIHDLSKHLSKVSLTSLKSTGLSSDIMIEVLESEDLLEIEKMIETYKSGHKAKYGRVSDVIITEKCMVREMTG